MCAVSKDANTGSSFETFASLIPQDEGNELLRAYETQTSQ